MAVILAIQLLRLCQGQLRYYLACVPWVLNLALQFEKVAKGRVIICGKELPVHPDYDFQPRPPHASLPPIHPHIFDMAFNGCGSNCWIPLFHDCFEIDEEGLTNRIPKKKSPFDVDSRDLSERYAWGLQARYRISGLRVMLYHILILVVPFILWGWWLKNHPDDIQSASIPLTVILMLISLFWSATGILKAARDSSRP